MEDENKTTQAEPQVDVAPVLIKDVNILEEFNGRIEATQHVSLMPRLSGYIKNVSFKEGLLVNHFI